MKDTDKSDDVYARRRAAQTGKNPKWFEGLSKRSEVNLPEMKRQQMTQSERRREDEENSR